MSPLEKLMSTPISIEMESTIADVVKMMLERKIGRVIVAENKKQRQS
jgi:predicted transcriptional regulator